ncbi:DUF3011 domain-containing protein [Rhodanobacter denitrificans]|uniref:DUF3011 domain-containing protein n=1 Tax=Rhodanobacter denitrificans TaxID=666685 RepID=UPI000260D4F0|nr:DUF3011 domain-containing protein [Rhodanobacter denitrificans]EIM04872.1 hypothetical protein UUC_01045 [Rhodanobacter denitrificans]UJM89912.1 DUF3011 domain-containing protein [Rhodanobacter denitrificans]
MRAVGRWAVGIIVAGLGGGLLGVAPPAQAQSDAPVRCVSNDGHYARCAVPWRYVELYKQESKAACLRGESWGMDHGTLWVDRGCRGLFGPAERDDYAYGNRDRGRYDGRPGDRDDDAWGDRRDERYDDRDDDRGDWRPGPGWDRRISLQCDSNQKKYQMCQVDVGRHGRVRLGRQFSDANCVEGYSWGWNRAGVWVAHGCRGQFLVDRRW